MEGPRVNPPTDSPLAYGTVGWADDGGTFYELGSADDDGSILVRVTLFRGRDPTKKLDHTVAQGQEILCKLASNFVQVPPRGSRVVVCAPDGSWRVPGGPMLIASDNANPELVGNLKDGEVGIAAASAKGRILLKRENDCIALYTVDASGKAAMVYVGADKIQLGNAFGALTIDASGVSLALAAGTAGLVLSPGPPATCTLSGTQISVSGQLAAIAGQIATCVGAGAVPSGVPGATPGPTSALYGLSAVAALPSKNVFIGP